MRKLPIRFSALAIAATALVVAPAIVPSPANAASRHMRMKRHHWHGAYHYGAAHYRAPWTVAPAGPVVGSYQASSPVCPGIGRSFDCKIWPPPFEDDPDRKASKY